MITVPTTSDEWDEFDYLAAIVEQKPATEIGEPEQEPTFGNTKFDKVLASVNRKHGR